MTASNLLVTFSAGQFVALLWFGLRIGERIGAAEATQASHGVRLDVLEPDVKQLSQQVGVLRGRCLGRHDYETTLQRS
jgi:hypothetical protein